MRRTSRRFAASLLFLLLAGGAHAEPALKRAILGVNTATTTGVQAQTRAYAVPEPGAMFLMSIGGVGLLGYRWRRRMLLAG